MNEGNKVFRLKGKVQHYAWGGHSFIPALLSIPNLEDRPFAEYWLGAHDIAPSELFFEARVSKVAGEPTGGLLTGGVPLEDTGGVPLNDTNGVPLNETNGVPLNQYIREHPVATLGDYVAGRFGRLPYLLKILDVKDMLSIQVHPSKKNAELEFAAENEKGVAPDAPHRNYKDDNHKPELMMALSEFWLLHGFKPAADLKRILQAVPELQFLAPVFEGQGYQGLYKTVMEMDQAAVNGALQPLLDRVIPEYQAHRLSKKHEDFWAARAALTFNEPGRIDRGIFSIYLFNLLNLHPGEAIFQDAGLPHAYLEGQNVEIMANSDNVLRGGLTPKHIDVRELLKHILFAETVPRIIGSAGAGGARADGDRITTFFTPAPDFELARIRLDAHDEISSVNPSVGIFIVLKGRLRVSGSGESSFERSRGEAFVAFDQAKLSLQALEDTEVYRASVPMASV
jgi:mannose-6-phosphate isomerase